MDTATSHKQRWEQELTRRRVLGITDLEEPVPHPDDIRIDFRKEEVRITGPMTREDKAERDALIAQKPEYEAVLLDLEHKLATEDDPNLLAIYEEDLVITRSIIDMISRPEAHHD